MATTGRLNDIHFDKGYGTHLGFSVVGGVDTAYGGAFVSNVHQGSDVAEAGLCEGDRLLAVEGEGLMGLSHVQVLDSLNRHRGVVHMVVQQLGTQQWNEVCSEVNSIEATAAVGSLIKFFYRAIAIRKDQNHPESQALGEVRLVKLARDKGGGRMGFKIAGGFDSTLGGVFVTSVNGGAALAADLKVGFTNMRLDVDGVLDR